MENGIIKTNINENVNINGSVVIKNENGMEQQIMYMSCSLNADTFASNINVSVDNKELYKAHAAEIKEEYTKFKKLVDDRATALGYVIF